MNADSVVLTYFLIQLVYLPDRKREYLIDDDVGSVDSEISEGRFDIISPDSAKDDKKYRRRGMLGWFKSKVKFGLLSDSSFMFIFQIFF